MRTLSLVCFGMLFSAALAGPCRAWQGANEDDYYRLTTLPIPEDLVLEVGALERLPDGRLAVATRRGDIVLVSETERPEDGEPLVEYQQFAGGLHEVLGLAWRDGWLYATQRGEVSRLRDDDGDGRADRVETVCDRWEISGDYHEYAFGSKFDRNGDLWVALCLTGSFTSDVPFRGWCVRVHEDGTMTPTCSGLRSPGGIGMNAAGDMFYTDNQGPWNGTCSLKHLRIGSFQGHPAGNRWYPENGVVGPRPEEPRSESRMMVEAERIPQLEPPAVYFPYQKMGQSASGIACDATDGGFGPFAGQMFVGDQTHSTVMRVFLEEVNGHYQGACFPFRAGFSSGSLALLMTADGTLYVGGTNRGWGSRGNRPFALERLDWTGEVPFEVREMRAEPDGFTLTFTHEVDREAASDPESYRLQTYTYIYQSNYGSPEVDHTMPRLFGVEVHPGGRAVRLRVDGLQVGHVHELHLDGVRNADGDPLLHPVGYYTLNYLPGGA